jgi:class 3 adenylate cyclase
MSGKSSLFSFRKVGTTRVVPLYGKIVMLFLFFILASNLATNYITLIQGRAEQVRLMNQLLVKELKENFVTAGNQFEVYQYEPDLNQSRQTLAQGALKVLESNDTQDQKAINSLAMGVDDNGNLLYFASPNLKADKFTDTTALTDLIAKRDKGIVEGPVEFTLNDRLFFGYAKYQPDWKSFLIRAEDKELFFAKSWAIFGVVSIIILVITALTSILAIFLLRHQFRFVDRITNELMKMQTSQELGIINMEGAPNDDVTYLGLSFNQLSSTVHNLMNIFRKFVTQDVASRAYKERDIRLEGTKQDLTILFTDIKGFTYMTETLGNDIIKLLNLHYDEAIRKIQGRDGIVGSIIGDALLAVFGTIEDASDRKAYKSLLAAYEIQEVAAHLRTEMLKRRDAILKDQGKLTPEEEKVFKAVMIEVGVGIDSGEVFYGNIGSYVRMTNTVIGDNVNSASRLEGLTRVYKVPVIVSESVMTEVTGETQEFLFIELDQVQVKGKTVGKRIYWPVRQNQIDGAFKSSIDLFAQALGAYYEGRWKESERDFKASRLPQAEIFMERIAGAKVPANWNGIWTMTRK